MSTEPPIEIENQFKERFPVSYEIGKLIDEYMEKLPIQSIVWQLMMSLCVTLELVKKEKASKDVKKAIERILKKEGLLK